MRALFVLLAAASIAGAMTAADQQVLINKDEIKWDAAPAALPAGAKMAVLFGDPRKNGPFTIRMSAPEGYKIPPHWHSHDEDLTVISGSLYIGMGDNADVALANALEEGGYHHLPAKAHHYAFTKKATVVQVSGEGPFDITYVNSEDAPRK
jgi:hypothetical protein